jgi:DNA-binding GntR family transcriptional regulator
MEELKNHPTLGDRTIEIIERAVLDGSIRSGHRIVEMELARRLGISKAPVREALKKLEGDGIVQRLPRRGYIVKPITLQGVNDFFDVMFIIEPVVAKLAIKKKNDSVCEQIDEIIEEMKDSLKKEDYISYLRLNEEFHGLFYKLVENEWIIKICQMLRKQARILRSLSLFTKDRFTSSIKEHISIIDAFKKGNAELLAKAVKFHLQMFKKNILESDLLKLETIFSE